MSALGDLRPWLVEHQARCLEVIVPDQSGTARGKIHPVHKIPSGSEKLPLAVFTQTINGTYHMRQENIADRDMLLRPDHATLRMVPWAYEPTATVIADCFDQNGKAIAAAPRHVLRRVLKLYEQSGWHPVVAPEVEFYLTRAEEGPAEDEKDVAVEPSDADPVDPYGVDSLHDLADFFGKLTGACRGQDIAIGSVSQELGPGQFEANFHHGPALHMADDVFRFKRTVKRLAQRAGLQATFLAKLNAEYPGSSMHLHQSVYDDHGKNLFSRPDGEASRQFENYIGGLQQFLRPALILFAPYANSYRRFLSHWSSPVNLEWGIDNRTVGLRVPECPPESRRVENRLAGSDVNPYLAIAATLAAGYLGIKRGIEASAPVTGSAYSRPFGLYRHCYEAIDSLDSSEGLREVLGDEFIDVYCAMKRREYRDFQELVPEWERVSLARSI